MVDGGTGRVDGPSDSEELRDVIVVRCRRMVGEPRVPLGNSRRISCCPHSPPPTWSPRRTRCPQGPYCSQAAAKGVEFLLLASAPWCPGCRRIRLCPPGPPPTWSPVGPDALRVVFPVEIRVSKSFSESLSPVCEVVGVNPVVHLVQPPTWSFRRTRCPWGRRCPRRSACRSPCRVPRLGREVCRRISCRPPKVRHPHGRPVGPDAPGVVIAGTVQGVKVSCRSPSL